MPMFQPSVSGAGGIRQFFRSQGGVQPEVPENAGTVVFGTATSTLNGKTAGAVSYAHNSALLTYNVPMLDDGTGRGYGAHITLSDGSKSAQNTPIICAFDTDEPEIEAVFRGTQFAECTAFVYDGTTLSIFPRRVFDAFPNSGSPVNVKYSLAAASVQHLEMALIARSAGGSGYAVGDTVTVSGGTAVEAATAKVIQVASGAVSILQRINTGKYTALPSSPAATTSSGAGTGCTVTWVTGARHTTRHRRTWFVVFHGSALKFHGINIPDNGAIYKAAGLLPLKTVFVGDSQSSGTYLSRPAGHMGITIAQMLGVLRGMPQINAFGGTGYETPNAGALGLEWSAPARIADFIAAAGDVYVWVGSQNDNGASATLQQKVIDTIGAVATALPNSVHFGISSVLNNGGHSNLAAKHAAAFAQLAAAYPGRIGFYNNVAANWFTGTGRVNLPSGTGNNDRYLSSDNAHYGQDGIDYFAGLAAGVIYDWLASSENGL